MLAALYRCTQALTTNLELDLSVLATRGAIVTLPDTSFPLAEIAAAHALAETGPTGRALLDIR